MQESGKVVNVNLPASTSTSGWYRLTTAFRFVPVALVFIAGTQRVDEKFPLVLLLLLLRQLFPMLPFFSR